ncbi:MAG: apolipoprotein A1/A4/E family protein [Mogibacterium sp.]|nr:apolipoprotein A1/A4/E family protein [Mogibacterium sp.]
MADKKTIEKVKTLLEGHCYGPLKEAAEKWLEIADEKYDVKEKAGKAWDKLNDAADAFVEASGKFNEKMTDIGEKAVPAFEKAKEKAGPALDKLQDKAAPAIDKAKEKAAPALDKIQEKAAPAIDKIQEKAAPAIDKIQEKAEPTLEKLAEMELIKQLKEGIATLSENIAFFSTDKGAEVVGSKEAAEQIKKHAEMMKADGKTYCDCEACTNAREILKALGEDIGE